MLGGMKKMLAILSCSSPFQTLFKLLVFVFWGALVCFIARSESAIAIAIATGLSRDRFFICGDPKGGNSAISRPETLRFRSSCERNEKVIGSAKILAIVDL